MDELRIGHVRPRPANRLGRTLFVGLAIALAGCARSGPFIQDSWNVGGPVPATADAAARPRAETEADGLPAQTPPPRRKSSGPDDPSEPFSPNYGPRPAPAVNAGRPHIPDDLPPAFRRRLASAIGD